MITQHVYLSMVPGSVPPVIHVSQYDNGTRALVFTITDNGLDYTGLSVRIDGIKPDGNAFSYGNGEDFSITRAGNVVTSDCVTQMTAVSGTVRCALAFYNEALDRLESADFVLEVKRAAIEDDSTISETELPAIIELAKQEQDNAEQYMNAAEGFSFDAEAWAKGTRDGEPVESGDPTYQSNSFFFSNRSASYATASAYSASESADAATLSESWAKGGTGSREGEDTNNASFFAYRSSSYATASAYSASASEMSAEAAHGSEVAAKASEDASADSAEDAEAWAKGTRGGTDVQQTDPTYHNNAKYHAEEAQGAETLSESYAHGGTGARSGEDTDNAKYYMEQARRIAEGVTADEVYYDNTNTGLEAEEAQTAIDTLAEMILSNHFVAHIIDDDGYEIADEDGNSIMGDFRYQVA